VEPGPGTSFPFWQSVWPATHLRKGITAASFGSRSGLGGLVPVLQAFVYLLIPPATPSLPVLRRLDRLFHHVEEVLCPARPPLSVSYPAFLIVCLPSRDWPQPSAPWSQAVMKLKNFPPPPFFRPWTRPGFKFRIKSRLLLSTRTTLRSLTFFVSVNGRPSPSWRGVPPLSPGQLP